MKLISTRGIIIVLCLLIQAGLYAQTEKSASRPAGFVPNNTQPKTKVMVLGMFHFASNQDRIKMNLDDMMSDKKQKEIEELDKSLSKFKPGKIFIEWEPERQHFVDSLYREYMSGNFQLKANEVYQIGFRLAKAMNLPTVYCMDAPGDYLFDTLIATAKKYGQTRWFDGNNETIMKTVQKQDSLGKLMTVKERLALMNTPENIMFSHYGNAGITSAAYLGEPGEYGAAEFIGEWYKRNIRMYANVCRLTSPEDGSVLIIVGAGHARILRHFLEDNPAFELVEAVKYLK